MKKAIISTIIFLCVSFTIFGQRTNQKILGTWTGTFQQNEGVTTNVTWTFLTNGKGVVLKVMSSASSNGIVCRMKQPFTWIINSSDQVAIAGGRTSCNCTSTGGQSTDELSGYATGYENETSNETYTYDVAFENSKILTMGGVRMKKK